MNREDNKRLVMVGLFSFAAIAILTIGILTLGKTQQAFKDQVHVNAVFRDVSGLRAGNNVWFAGVKIGVIKGIKFIGQSQVEVEMKLDNEAARFIPKNSTVVLGSEGFIGNKIVEIIGGTENTPHVQDGDRLAVVSATDTEQIMETLQANNKNLLAITSDLKNLTAGLVSGKSVAGTLLSDSLMAVQFKSIVNDLERVSKQTVATTTSLNRFTQKLHTEDGLANKLLTDTAVFASIRSSAAQMELLSRQFAQTSAKLNDPNNAVGTLLSDKQFADDLKSSMHNLESGTQKLDQNMEALQHNFLLRGFFKKQEKKKGKQGEFK
jgi:phospholipid/cholesterol/gamma-HCH transport system substrate-binding protein